MSSTSPTSKAPNGFVRFMRKVYQPIGFRKGYNFALWFIFGGALLGFALARLQYLDFWGKFCNGTSNGINGAGPGECYWYEQGIYQVGIIMHLACAVPSALLAVLQFVPAIRYKALLFHRINGYVIIVMTLGSIAGVLMIARRAFGGGLAIQTAVGFMAILAIGSLVMAIVNIKRLQIEQHRAWMLRLWAYMGAVVTVRIVMAIAAFIISAQRNYYAARPCAQLAFILKSPNKLLNAFPECEVFVNGTDVNQYALVHAGFTSEEGASVALGMGFETAIWLALGIHSFAVELYLHLTPREAERLRRVSYQKQLEAGMKNPGSAGLVVQRLGDAEPWIPPVEEAKDIKIDASDAASQSDDTPMASV